jgi:hypothetical protein
MPSMTGNSIHADMLRATAFIKNYLKNISKEQIMIMTTAIYKPYFAGGKATLIILYGLFFLLSFSEFICI